MRKELFGNENSPVLFVDAFLEQPEALVEYAATQCDFQPVKHNFYPGLRARAPNNYIETVIRRTEGLIREVFGLAGKRLMGADCDFSLVTIPPSKLQLPQALPHFDATDMHQIAVLHYLCTPDKGGTSFYRHRSTGYETITDARRDPYLKQLAVDMGAEGLPEQAYINGDTKLFERIGSIDAVFNRLVAYRSAVLHSGDIPPNFQFATDARTGRLTVNTFLYFR